MRIPVSCVLLLLLFSLGCIAERGSGNANIDVSSVFGNKEFMQQKYTCNGADVSPPLHVQNLSNQTQTLAVIVEDYDAPKGVFVHWVVWNLPASNVIPENADIKSLGGVEGMNDFGSVGYRGPCPPPGAVHNYVFTVYALDSRLNLSEESTAYDLRQSMHGHIIAESELVGLYSR